MSTAAAVPQRRPSTLRTPAEESRFHFAYADLLFERGYPNLARSHQIVAGLYLPDKTRAANLKRSRVLREDARRERFGRGEE